MFLIEGGGILLGEVILDDDKRGPAQSLSFSMSMFTACTKSRMRSGKEFEQLLQKHGFVQIQYRQNEVPFLVGVVFARKP